MVPLLSVGHYSPVVPGDLTASFFALTPYPVLDAVEVGGLRSTGRCLPLRACENRVYEVELEDERRLVVKFHRPGRWSREAILDEHAFLRDLAEAELPVVAPLDLGKGSTLGEIDGIFYTTFPKIRGRMTDELDADGRRRIGRTIGRVHAVGAARPAPHRPRMSVERYVHEPLEVLMAGDFIPGSLARRARWEIVEGYEVFRELDRSTLELCEPLRALRIIYMSAWIARRWDDPSFPVAFPTFRDHRYWMHEYEALIAIAE